VKSIIIYSSLTGNTKKVAQAIHSGMSRLVEQCDITTVKEVDIRLLAEYDLIGLGSPVWSRPYGGPAPNVKTFIDALPLLNGKHTIVFCTHGIMPDLFFPTMVRLLMEKGLIVIGTRDWYGNVNLPYMPKPYLTDGHPDEIDLKAAEKFGREMVGISQRIHTGETHLIPPIPLLPISKEQIPKLPRRPRPRLNKQKCRYPQCHLCIDNCPASAINLSVSPPVFAEKCYTCFFCEMICPEGAVEVEYEPFTQESLKVVSSSFNEALDKAESEGRFRRLVSKEDVGWDAPYYKVHNRHPRYVNLLD